MAQPTPQKKQDSAAAIIQPSLKVGAAFGTVGFLYGGFQGTLTNTTPLVFATASGIRSLLLGTTFWASRSTILDAWTTDDQPSTHYTSASAIAGGFAGGFAAILTKGRSSVLPATIVWSLLGTSGQFVYNKITAPREAKESIWKRLAARKWSPFTYISDEDYADVLREKLLRVDADISIIDDRITALREKAADEQKDIKSDSTDQ